MAEPIQNVNPNAIVGRQVPAPAEPLVSVKLNHRYGNVNAGEIAGYPEREARWLLETKVPGTDMTVASPNKSVRSKD